MDLLASDLVGIAGDRDHDGRETNSCRTRKSDDLSAAGQAGFAIRSDSGQVSRLLAGNGIGAPLLLLFFYRDYRRPRTPMAGVHIFSSNCFPLDPAWNRHRFDAAWLARTVRPLRDGHHLLYRYVCDTHGGPTPGETRAPDA